MNIKIEFRGKVHKMAPGLKSLEDIQNDVRARYPAFFKNGLLLAYLEAGHLKALSSFEELQSLVSKAGNASVKLKIFEGKELPQDVGNSQYSYRKDSNGETGVFEVVSLDEIKKPEEPFFSPDISIIERKQEQLESEEPKKELAPVVEAPPAEVKIEEAKPAPIENAEPARVEVQKPAVEVGKFYACYQCKGKPPGSECPLCEGKGRVGEGHPLITFIDEILNDRLQILQDKLLNLKLAEKKPEPKEEVKLPDFKKPEESKPVVFGWNQSPQETFNRYPGAPSYSRKSMSDGYSFAFTSPLQNKVVSPLSPEVLWNLRIINNGSVAWPKHVFLYRIAAGGKPDQIFTINGVRPGETIDVTIGFRAHQIGSLEMVNLRLGYVDLYEGVIYFGQKFGFELDTRPELPAPEKLRDIENIIRDKILAAMRLVKHQRHSATYILSRVRQLGFSEDITVEVLADIIASLQ